MSLALRRSYRGRCWAYDGVRERFARARCGTAKAFKVASGGELLLPAAERARARALRAGRDGADAAGNTIALARGTSRVVFYVG